MDPMAKSGATRAKRSLNGKEGHGEEKRMREAADSPPLDEANWLRANENPPRLRELRCELENLETWEQFDQLGTEMIITKSGRRMFPVLRLRLYGTRPGFLYFIYLDMVPIQGEHRFRYAYNKSQWQSAGKAERSQFGRLYLHADSPFSRDQLAQPGHVVSFDKAKLTNDPNTQNHDQLLLNSMHKYRPRVHVVCMPRGDPMSADPLKEFCTKADLDWLAGFDYKTFIFPRTTFVAVTAHQNQLVTQKKIELNPFVRDQKVENETDESRAKCLLIDPPPPASSSTVPPDPPSDSSSLTTLFSTVEFVHLSIEMVPAGDHPTRRLLWSLFPIALFSLPSFLLHFSAASDFCATCNCCQFPSAESPLASNGEQTNKIVKLSPLSGGGNLLVQDDALVPPNPRPLVPERKFYKIGYGAAEVTAGSAVPAAKVGIPLGSLFQGTRQNIGVASQAILYPIPVAALIVQPMVAAKCGQCADGSSSSTTVKSTTNKEEAAVGCGGGCAGGAACEESKCEEKCDEERSGEEGGGGRSKCKKCGIEQGSGEEGGGGREEQEEEVEEGKGGTTGEAAEAAGAKECDGGGGGREVDTECQSREQEKRSRETDDGEHGDEAEEGGRRGGGGGCQKQPSCDECRQKSDGGKEEEECENGGRGGGERVKPTTTTSEGPPISEEEKKQQQKQYYHQEQKIPIEVFKKFVAKSTGLILPSSPPSSIPQQLSSSRHEDSFEHLKDRLKEISTKMDLLKNLSIEMKGAGGGGYGAGRQFPLARFGWNGGAKMAMGGNGWPNFGVMATPRIGGGGGENAMEMGMEQLQHNFDPLPLQHQPPFPPVQAMQNRIQFPAPFSNALPIPPLPPLPPIQLNAEKAPPLKSPWMVKEAGGPPKMPPMPTTTTIRSSTTTTEATQSTTTTSLNHQQFLLNAIEEFLRESQKLRQLVTTTMPTTSTTTMREKMERPNEAATATLKQPSTASVPMEMAENATTKTTQIPPMENGGGPVDMVPGGMMPQNVPLQNPPSPAQSTTTTLTTSTGTTTTTTTISTSPTETAASTGPQTVGAITAAMPSPTTMALASEESASGSNLSTNAAGNAIENVNNTMMGSNAADSNVPPSLAQQPTPGPFNPHEWTSSNASVKNSQIGANASEGGGEDVVQQGHEEIGQNIGEEAAVAPVNVPSAVAPPIAQNDQSMAADQPSSVLFGGGNEREMDHHFVNEKMGEHDGNEGGGDQKGGGEIQEENIGAANMTVRSAPTQQQQQQEEESFNRARLISLITSVDHHSQEGGEEEESVEQRKEEESGRGGGREEVPKFLSARHIKEEDGEKEEEEGDETERWTNSAANQQMKSFVPCIFATTIIVIFIHLLLSIMWSII